MDKQRLLAIAKRFGTPSFVFDESALAARMLAIKEIVGGSVHLCYSIKANPFLIPAMQGLCELLEVCSPGELEICTALHVDPGTVLFSGVTKTEEDIDRAMDAGVTRFTAESPLHVELLHAAAKARGRVYPVLLRLTAGSQFGMDERDVKSIIANRADYPGVAIVGIHFFSGTMKKKAAVIEKELRKVLSFMDGVKTELGFTLEKLEYGTGLAVDYFSPEADELESARLDAVAPIIREAAERYDLTVEMGRFFAAPCGAYATRVVDMKTNEGVNYAILDGGAHQIRYDGQIQGMQTPNIVHLPQSEGGEAQPWTLCGSLCTTADVLARGVELAGLSIGDVLLFTRTGAYSLMEGMSIFLSRDLPAIYLKTHNGEVRLLRAPLAADPFNSPGIF